MDELIEAAAPVVAVFVLALIAAKVVVELIASQVH